MRVMNVYVGLDLATTSGVAAFSPETQKAYVAQVKGSPIKQLSYLIEGVLFDDVDVNYTIVMEKLHNFRNANTTRILLELSGYLKYSLLDRDYRVEEVSPDMARAYLKAPGKEHVFRKFVPYFSGVALTNNHTDALAVALYQAHSDGHEVDFNRLIIEQRESSK